jgi:hypothetical protein
MIDEGKATFQQMFGLASKAFGPRDILALDKIMSHPDYERRYRICVLNPSLATFENVHKLPA